MLESLNLKNFRTHDNLEVSFTPGLNGIFGSNYTGKTTLLYGILYCLGGASMTSGIELQKRGTTRGFKQQLTFSCEGLRYRVERSKTSANLYELSEEEETLLASGTTPVNKQMEEILGMDLKMFKKLRYSQQKKTHALLTLGATELHKLIDQLTGIDDVNAVIKKLSEGILQNKGRLEGMGEVEDPKPYRLKLRDLKKQTKILYAQRAEKTSELATLQESHTLLANQLKRFRELHQDYEDYCTRKSKLEGRLAVLQESQEKLPCEESLEGQLADLNKSLPVLRDRFQEVKDTVDKRRKLETQLDSLKEGLKDHEEKLSSIIRKEEGALSEMKAAKSTYDEHTAGEKLRKGHEEKLANMRSTLKRAASAVEESACPTCNRPYDSAEELQAAKEELAQVTECLEGLKAERKELNERQAKLSEGATVYKEAEEALRRLKALREDLQEGASEGSRRVEEKEALLDEVEKYTSAHLNEAGESLSAEEYRLKLLTSQLDELAEIKVASASVVTAIENLEAPDYDASAHDKTVTRFEALPPLGDLREALSKVEQEYSLSAHQERACGEKLQQITEVLNRRNKVRAKMDVEKALVKFLRDNRDRFSAGIWAKFMHITSAFVASCTGGAIEAVERTEDGAFTFIEDSRDMSVKDASGAQASIMGLGVQLALAEALQSPLNILLVDEPTADMDPEHSLATSMMLARSSKQVIAVSHAAMDSSVCASVISLGGEGHG